MENLTIDKAIQMVANQDLAWKQVWGLICVNTEYQGYNFKLCAYNHNGVPAISINVNNTETGQIDVVDDYFFKGTSQYSILKSTYDRAVSTGEKIGTRPAINI